MRKRFLAAVAAMLTTLLFPACRAENPQPPYAPVTTSNPIILHLSGGQGTGSIFFSIAPGRQLPTKIRALDAVGPSNTVPAGDIQLGDAKLDEDGKSFTLPIKVTASVALDPGKPYTGSIVLFSKDDKDPVNVKIQLEDNLTVAFEVSPTPIAASLNDRASLCQTLHLKNTGNRRSPASA